MKEIKQYYNILGLPTNANANEVKQAYRKLAKLWHPDRFHNNPIQQQEAEAKFKFIVEAYEILKNYNHQAERFKSSSKVHTQKSNPYLHYQQGTSYAEAEQYQEAIEEFSQAIRLDNTYINAYQYRGFLLAKLGYKNRADADFKKVNELKVKTNYQQSSSQRKAKIYQRSSQTRYESPSTERQKTNIRIPNLSSKWQFKQILKGYLNSVNLVAISPNSQILASVGKSKTVKLWNLLTGDEITLLSQHKSLIRCLKFTMDGQYLVSGSEDKSMIIWDLKNQKSNVLGNWKTGHNQAVLCLDVSSDGKILVSGSADKTVKIWDLNSKTEPYTLTGYGADILTIAISPNQELFVSGGLEKNIRIRRLDNGKLVRSLTANLGVTSVAFSPDNKLLATGGFDRLVRLWHWETGEEIGRLEGHLEQITALVFSPDGQTIMTGSLDETIKIWKLGTQAEIASLPGNYQGVLSLDLSADGKTLVSGCGDNAIRVFMLK